MRGRNDCDLHCSRLLRRWILHQWGLPSTHPCAVRNHGSPLQFTYTLLQLGELRPVHQRFAVRRYHSKLQPSHSHLRVPQAQRRKPTDQSRVRRHLERLVCNDSAHAIVLQFD